MVNKNKLKLGVWFVKVYLLKIKKWHSVFTTVYEVKEKTKLLINIPAKFNV